MIKHHIHFQLHDNKQFKSVVSQTIFSHFTHGISTCLLTGIMLLLSFQAFSQASEESFNLAQKMYIAYYGRPGDPEGLQFWGERFDESDNLEEILDAFGKSTEFTFYYGGLSSAELVNEFYRNMFSRDAEPSGLAFYVEQLESGEASPVSIAKQISDFAVGNDLVALENKMIVAQEFSSIASTKENAVIDIPGIKNLLSIVTSDDDISLALLIMLEYIYEPLIPRYRVLVVESWAFPFPNQQTLLEGKGYRIIKSQEEYEPFLISSEETVDFNENTVVLFNMGVRPSSGYSVKVAHIEDQRDAIKLNLALQTPGSGCFSAQVLTSPFILLEVYTLDESRAYPRHKEILINESIVPFNCE